MQVVARDIESWFADEQRREQRRRDACARKRWFESESEARAHAAMQRSRHGEVVHPYRCPLCDGWHLSSGPAEGSPAPERR